MKKTSERLTNKIQRDNSMKMYFVLRRFYFFVIFSTMDQSSLLPFQLIILLYQQICDVN